MENSEPVATGISSFLKNFGDRIAKGSDNQDKTKGKEALDAYKNGLGPSGTEKFKQSEADKRNQVRVNAHGATSATADMNNKRKVLKSVEAAERTYENFRKAVLNPMATNVSPTVHTLVDHLTKEGMAKGLPVEQAQTSALHRAFATYDPSTASLISGAHKNGMVAHYLSDPQLQGEFQDLAGKYAKPIMPQPAPGAPPQGAPQPKPEAPGPQSMAPPQGMPAPPPQQPAQAPPPKMAAMPPMPQQGMPKVPVNTPMPGQAGPEESDIG